MPKSTTPDAPARRALIEDIKDDRRGWLQHGAAALAVSLLGLGVAGSVVLTGNAQPTQVAVPSTRVAASTDPAVQLPSAFDRDASSTSRDSAAARPSTRPRCRASPTSAPRSWPRPTTRSSRPPAPRPPRSARRRWSRPRRPPRSRRCSSRRAPTPSGRPSWPRPPSRTPRSPPPAPRPPATQAPAETGPVNASGKSCMPVRGGYSIAARFGQVGSWSRYHTGFDFSAPVGTPLQAPASGVVTNAGLGSGQRLGRQLRRHQVPRRHAVALRRTCRRCR